MSFVYSNGRKKTLHYGVRCPECGVPMVEREGRVNQDGNNRFFGCSRFPLCIGTRPAGSGVDSYTSLLRNAYTRAVVFLASPRLMGAAKAGYWLKEQALGHALSDAEHDDLSLQLLSNEALEQAIDAACAYVAEQGVDFDFLVAAHEERMAHVHAKLKYSTDPTAMRNMPKPEIVRRYDMGRFDQLEANITTEWTADGRACPRCGAYSEKCGPGTIRKRPVRSLDDLFEPAETAVETWNCPSCGLFSKLTEAEGTTRIVFSEDKNDKMNVPGIVLPSWRARRNER